MKWYGSIQNRIEENHDLVPVIEVGTGMTQYGYTDCHAWEVIEVKDQKHVIVREYDHKLIGEAYTNDWELISNPDNRTMSLTKRGKYWYKTVTIDVEWLDSIDMSIERNKIDLAIFLAQQNTSEEEVRRKGKVTRYYRENVSFGKATYYYDYSF